MNQRLARPSFRLPAVLALVAGAATLAHAAPTTIQFGNELHGLTGHSAAVVNSGAYQMSLAAGPAGAVLDESHDAGLGVNSTGVSGAVDVGATFGTSKINVIGGAGPFSGMSERISFSFNQAGVLRALLLDGVKDETLEYISLTTPGGTTLSLFDFETLTRLAEQGFGIASLAVPNVTLLDDSEDDRSGLHIPFQAGEAFTLAYGEVPFPAGYTPRQNDAGNGARWEGVVVIPEPTSLASAAIAVVMGTTALRSRGRAAPRRTRGVRVAPKWRVSPPDGRIS